jgi:titin
VTKYNLGVASPIVVAGLTTAKKYTCAAAAANKGGNSPNGVSNAVIVGAPDSPTGVTAVRLGAGQVQVHFTPHNNNGSAITGYTVTCTSSNGGATVSKTQNATTINLLNATHGKTYACKVTANNARGPSILSAPSNSVVA